MQKEHCIGIRLPMNNQFGLLKRLDRIACYDRGFKKYNVLCNATGKFENCTHRIRLKSNNDPIVERPRKTPISMESDIKKELVLSKNQQNG